MVGYRVLLTLKAIKMNIQDLTKTQTMEEIKDNQQIDNNVFIEQLKAIHRKRTTMFSKKQIIFHLLFVCTLSISAQIAKKPTLMIVPSDNWCIQRYFIQEFNNQGQTIRVPNYQQAFQEDVEIGIVISKVGGLLTNCGYSLKDAEQGIKSLTIHETEDNITTSKTSGAFITETPLDILKRRLKSDIVLQIGWNINRENSGRSVTFTMEAFDSYTNKRIASSTGTTPVSQAPIPVLLEQGIKNQIEEFDQQMMMWYADQEQNGREIILTIRCWDNWENDLETEYNGEELIDCIQNWINNNTVNSAFNLSDGTEHTAQFEQVRIPLFDDKGKAMDARAFTTNLRKYLQQSPFNITSKVIIRGLGEAMLILGEK